MAEVVWTPDEAVLDGANAVRLMRRHGLDSYRELVAGYWFLHGRSDDTLNIAGKRIGPAEIESAAVAHPAVIEAAAVGVPHEVKGEVAWVFCVLAPGASASEDDLRALVVGELGKAFAPERVLFVPALPKTRSAKIVRRAVRATALGQDPGTCRRSRTQSRSSRSRWRSADRVFD